jgi:1-acyl-sn-glycerol-3-phosphate acyltransferase
MPHSNETCTPVGAKMAVLRLHSWGSGVQGSGPLDGEQTNVSKLLARIFLSSNGWETVGTTAADKKLVLIAGPHTSNWDLIHLLAIKSIRDVQISWIGKHTLFWWPLGPILRAVGGIPVSRDHPEGVVEQIVRAFDEAETLCLLITPEGTRSYTPYWKSGFYRIAKAAGVPIQLGFVDFSRRQAGFGPTLMPSGDVRADMDEIRAFYAGKVAHYPDQAGEIRLREEEDSNAKSTGVNQT